MFQMQGGTLFFAQEGTFGLQAPLGLTRVGLGTFGLGSILRVAETCGGHDRTGGLCDEDSCSDKTGENSHIDDDRSE
jgi:hypothetical protein